MQGVLENAKERMIPDVAPTMRAGGNATGGDRPPGTDVDTCESLIPEIADCLQERDSKGSDSSTKNGHLIPVENAIAIAFAQNQRNEVRELDIAGTVGTVRRGDAKQETLIAFSCKDNGRDARDDVAPTLRGMGHDGSHANGGGQMAVAFKPAHYTRAKDGAPSEVTPPLSADADKGDQDTVVAVSDLTGGAMPDTLMLQGIKGRVENGHATETDAAEILRILQKEIGEEAFTEWRSNVASALQQTKILQSDLHGEGMGGAESRQSQNESKQREIAGAEKEADGAMRAMREAERSGYSPPEQKHRRQSPRESTEALPILSQSQTQAGGTLQDLRSTGEGVWILQQALFALQEMGRPADDERQPIRSSEAGGRGQPASYLPSDWMRKTLSREWILQSSRDAGKTRKAVGRKEVPGLMAVRRLTPV